MTLANAGHFLGSQCFFGATGDTSGPVTIFDGLVSFLATDGDRLDTGFAFATVELGMDLLGVIFEHFPAFSSCLPFLSFFRSLSRVPSPVAQSAEHFSCKEEVPCSSHGKG